MLGRSLKNTMLRILIILTLIQAVYAGETAIKLYGSWKSNHKLTKAYLTKFAKLDAYQNNTLPNFFGNSVITFNPDGTGNIDIKAMSFPKKDGNGEFKLPASKTAFTYKILGETKSQLVIKTDTDIDVFSDFPFTILRFEDPNTYSVSLSDSVSDINGREFFTRLKPIKNADDPGIAKRAILPEDITIGGRTGTSQQKPANPPTSNTTKKANKSQ